MEWIRATDGLPKAYVPVIVCRLGKSGAPIVETGQLDVGGWWRVYGTRVKSVTHWMTMPEPPEEKEVTTT